MAGCVWPRNYPLPFARTPDSHLPIHHFQLLNHSWILQRSVSEKVQYWFSNTSIAFCEPWIPGPPPEGHNFGITGGVTEDRIENEDAVPAIVLWRTNWWSAGYRTPAEAARVLRSLTLTILGFFGDVLEPPELRGKASVPSEGGGGVTLTKPSKNCSSFD